MKYFTPDKYATLQDCSNAAAMDAADAAWQASVEAYDQYRKEILSRVPETVRRLEEGYFLHDADVLSIGRQGSAFVLVLQLDAPPNQLLTIAFELVGEPIINRAALPTHLRSPAMQWQYEELELLNREGSGSFLYSILFSNGWEVQVPFRELHFETAEPVYTTGRLARPIAQSA